MSKTTGFCFLLLIASVWSDSNVDPNLSKLQTLDSTILSVVSTIDDVLTKLENGIEGFKSVTWATINTFKGQADQIVNTVKDYVDYSSDKLEGDLSSLLHHNVTDLTCNLVGRFREQADLVFDRVRDCVEGPLNTTIEDARRVSDAGTDLRMELQINRKEVLKCKTKAANVAEKLACVTKASDSVNALAANVPKILLNLSKIGLQASTYPANLKICLAQTPLTVIREHYMSILLRFPECLTNKLVVTVTNVLNTLASAYQSVKEHFTKNPISSSSDVKNQILFNLEEKNPLNNSIFTDFLKRQEYPNLDILDEEGN